MKRAIVAGILLLFTSVTMAKPVFTDIGFDCETSTQYKFHIQADLSTSLHLISVDENMVPTGVYEATITITPGVINYFSVPRATPTSQIRLWATSSLGTNSLAVSTNVGCNPLAVKIIAYGYENVGRDSVKIKFTIDNEVQGDTYFLERSTDNVHWYPITLIFREPAKKGNYYITIKK